MQGFGLTEIIPLIRTSAVWSQYPELHILSFLRAHLREWLQSDGCWMTGILFLPEFPQGYPAHSWQWLQSQTMTAFVYWYCRKQATSHLQIKLENIKVSLAKE